MATGNASPSAARSLSDAKVDLNDLFIGENPGYNELKERCGVILTNFLLKNTVPTASKCLGLYEAFQSLILKALEEEHGERLVFVPGKDDDALNELVLHAIGKGFSVPFEKYKNYDPDKIIYSENFPDEGIEEKIFDEEFDKPKQTEINIPFGELIFNIALRTYYRSYVYGFDEAVETSIEVKTSWTEKGDTTEADSEIAKLEEDLEGAKNVLKSVSDNLASLSDPDDVLRKATELDSRLNQVKEIAKRLKLAKEKREAISGGSAAE